MDFEGAFFNTSDYQLQKEKLGEGTFGTVYTAKSNKDGQLYACKIIKTNDDFNGHEQMLLIKESLILNKLKHPGIAEFKGINFQSFEDPNKLEPSIITEYIKGDSLKAIIDQGIKSPASSTLTPTKKLILILGITNAMKYLHKNGIIHCDLKLENILIDEKFHPRICDFGLSTCFKKLFTNSGKKTMTPIYMAPELLTDDGNFSPNVDVYSFAMIAYELVTGKVPFSEIDSDNSLVIKVTNDYRPSFPEFIPTKMQELITRCWSKNASERPSFEEIFNELSKDFTYLGESVDEEEIKNYLSFIEESKVEKPSNLYEENNELRSELAELKKKLLGYTASEDLFISGLLKLHGHEKERNPKQGINYLNVSSEKGNSYSSLLLGLIHETGNEVECNFQKAKFYFELSSLQGNSNGYHLIGKCYDNGYAVKRDYSKALEYYQKAAELGNSAACNSIGNLYENGLGVKQDFFKAIEYYQKSADLGNSDGFIYIGYLYKNGLGVKQDYSKALELYQKSANLGNSEAFNCIGTLYKNGLGVKQDYSKALEYYQKATELGNSIAFDNIGYLYESGQGVKQDYSKALEYYQKSADLGNSAGFICIGYMYKNGSGVKHDYSKALEYYQRAADLGNPAAFKNIGSLYEDGRGVKQDYSKALEYYQKAVDLGSKNVLKKIHYLQRRMKK